MQSLPQQQQQQQQCTVSSALQQQQPTQTPMFLNAQQSLFYPSTLQYQQQFAPAASAMNFGFYNGFNPSLATNTTATQSSATHQPLFIQFEQAQQLQQQQQQQQALLAAQAAQQAQFLAYPFLTQMSAHQQPQLFMMPQQAHQLMMQQQQFFQQQQQQQQLLQQQQQQALLLKEDKSATSSTSLQSSNNNLFSEQKARLNFVVPMMNNYTSEQQMSTMTGSPKAGSLVSSEQAEAAELKLSEKKLLLKAALASNATSVGAASSSITPVNKLSRSVLKMQAKRLKQRLLGESTDAQRSLLVQVQQVSKQNSAKAFLKAYKKFAMQETTYIYAYDISQENKYYYKLCQDLPIVRVDNPSKKDIDGFYRKFKKFFNGKQYNNNTLKNVVRNKLYGKLFDDFLRFHSMDWLRQSKTKNKEDLSVLIRFLLICYDNTEYLVFLRDHEKASRAEEEEEQDDESNNNNNNNNEDQDGADNEVDNSFDAPVVSQPKQFTNLLPLLL